MILVTWGDVIARWDAKQYLEDPAVGTSEGVFSDMKCISPAAVVVTDIFHSGHHHMLKNFIDWVAFFLEQYCSIDKLK